MQMPEPRQFENKDNDEDGYECQGAFRLQARKVLASEYIQKALKHLELQELIELANEIYAEAFAKGEIASHRSQQRFN